MDSSNQYHGVFRLLIPLSEIEYFEKKWLFAAYEVVNSFPGFITRHVLQILKKDDFVEFVIVLVFDSLENYRNYLVSLERSRVVSNLHIHGIISYDSIDNGNFQELLMPNDSIHAVENTTTNSIKRISLHNTMTSAPKALPPSKWKLTLLLIHCVYITVVASNFSMSSFVMANSNIPKGMRIFITITHIVIMLQYAGLPLVMSIPFVNKWLRARRKHSEDMFPIELILDQGLKIFALRIDSLQIHNNVNNHEKQLRRLEKIEKRLESLRDMNSLVLSELAKLESNKHNIKKNISDDRHVKTVAGYCSYDSNTTITGDRDGGGSSVNMTDEDSHIPPDSTPTFVLPLRPIIPSPSNSTSRSTAHSRDVKPKDFNISNLIDISKLVQHNHSQKQDEDTIAVVAAGVDSMSSNGNDITHTQNVGVALPHSQHKSKITLAVRHFVKWEYVLEFEKWTNEMDREMAK